MNPTIFSKKKKKTYTGRWWVCLHIWLRHRDVKSLPVLLTSLPLDQGCPKHMELWEHKHFKLHNGASWVSNRSGLLWVKKSRFEKCLYWSSQPNKWGKERICNLTWHEKHNNKKLPRLIINYTSLLLSGFSVKTYDLTLR